MIAPPLREILLAWLVLAASAAPSAAEKSPWRPLFDGQSFDGWVNVNTAPETWSTRDGMIVCSGTPRGFLRTEETFENYILELEWRHTSKGGNAGVMVHADPLPQVGAPYPESVEVQVMDGDGGSMFGIRGCTIKPLTNPLYPERGHIRARPLENRSNPAGQWNKYRLTSRDGTLELAVNGKVVTRANDATQVAGHICLESERAEVHFRNIRIRELPSSNPPQDKVAGTKTGFTSLFDGISLRGWKTGEATKGRWTADDGIIRLRKEDQPPRKRRRNDHLWTKMSYRDFALIVDWRLTQKPVRKKMNSFTPDGLFRRDEEGNVVKHVIRHAGDSGIFLRGDEKAQINIWSQPMGSGDINPYHKDEKLPPEIRRACLPSTRADEPFGQWNRFEITIRGDHVDVTLNGTKVIDNAHLPGVAKSGPIGLQNHGDAIQFDNLYIKPLNDANDGE